LTFVFCFRKYFFGFASINLEIFLQFLCKVKPKANTVVYCFLFTILHPFGTRESIRRKVDHGG
jgi:hypothetical protein